MGSEVRVTDPKTGGQKGVKSERFDLLPWDALEEVARVYGYGATKYAPDNWLRGYSWRLSAGALARHLGRWMVGETRDPETGLHHLAHAAWHCLTLITFELRKLGTDDRRPPTLTFKPECPPDSVPPPAPVAPRREGLQVGDRVRVTGLFRRDCVGTVAVVDGTPVGKVDDEGEYLGPTVAVVLDGPSKSTYLFGRKELEVIEPAVACGAV